MIPQITLTIIKGNLKGQTFEFRDRDTCIMGRADECNPKLPNDEAHRTISRHHCLLDINPPQIRVRDFGSLNGTYINGEKIGQREAHQTPEEGAKLSFPERDLKQGDRIWLGTGHETNVEKHPLLSLIRETYPMEVINGLPVLDSHLRWQGCELYMMGAYAGLQVGPVARNIAGARMASNLIVPALTKSSLTLS